MTTMMTTRKRNAENAANLLMSLGTASKRKGKSMMIHVSSPSAAATTATTATAAPSVAEAQGGDGSDGSDDFYRRFSREFQAGRNIPSLVSMRGVASVA